MWGGGYDVEPWFRLGCCYVWYFDRQGLSSLTLIGVLFFLLSVTLVVNFHLIFDKQKFEKILFSQPIILLRVT